MKIVEIKVINIAATKLESVAKFIRNSPLSGPMEPYEEYAENRAMWTGGGEWIIPIVVITTDSGIEGYGFCCGGSIAPSIIIENHFKNYLIDSDPFDTELLWDKMFRASIIFGRKGAAIEAISGIDIALWDLKGKALGLPVYKLLGGKAQSKIKLYASNLHPSNLYNPDYDALAKEALDYKKQGYKAMKQRICAGPREGRKGMQRNEMLVRAVREAIGDDIELMVDAYMSWADVDYAVEMVKRLEKYNLSWIEEPLLPDDFEGYKLLRSKTDIPIAAGEHEFTKFGYREMIKQNIVDILQPDTRRVGGITEAKKILSMCEAFGIPCAPHIAYPETIHLSLSSSIVKWGEHTCIPTWEKLEGGFSDAYIKGAPQAKDGYIEISDEKPGLGIELNMNVIERIKV